MKNSSFLYSFSRSQILNSKDNTPNASDIQCSKCGSIPKPICYKCTLCKTKYCSKCSADISNKGIKCWGYKCTTQPIKLVPLLPPEEYAPFQSLYLKCRYCEVKGFYKEMVEHEETHAEEKVDLSSNIRSPPAQPILPRHGQRIIQEGPLIPSNYGDNPPPLIHNKSLEY